MNYNNTLTILGGENNNNILSNVEYISSDNIYGLKSNMNIPRTKFKAAIITTTMLKPILIKEELLIL